MTVKSKVFLLPIPYINFTDKWNSIEKSIFYDDLTLINMNFFNEWHLQAFQLHADLSSWLIAQAISATINFHYRNVDKNHNSLAS